MANSSIFTFTHKLLVRAKSIKKVLLFTLYFFGVIITSSAQQENINFTSINTKDGLSSNTVNAILKDKYGLMWFGTSDGLNKFDGINFTVYRNKPGDSESLRANEILSLHQDKAGNLWVGTSGGSLSLYDRNKDAFINFTSNSNSNTIDNNVILDICSDYKGNIWIAHYTGINILDPVTHQISQIPVTRGSSVPVFTEGVHCVFEDSKHQMWLATSEGLYEYNPETKVFKHYLHLANAPNSLAHNSVTSIAEDTKGNLWIGTFSGVSMRPNGQTGFINYNQNAEKGLGVNLINAIAIDSNKIWIGANEGLDVLNTTTGNISHYRHDYRNHHSLTDKSVRCIFIDDQGIYWVGTIGGGVNKYDKNLHLFNYIQSNIFDEKGLNVSIITSFAEDNNNNIYIGSQSKRLSLFNRKTKLFQYLDLRSGKTISNDVASILALKMSRNNELVIGTYSAGLFFLTPSTGKLQQVTKGLNPHDLNSDDIFCIKEVRNGNLWLGTNGQGVNVLNQDKKVVVKYTPNPKNANDILLPINGYIRDIEEDSQGNIWIATHGGGIAVLQITSGKFKIYNTQNSKLTNDKVLTLKEDSHGNMWAGTFGGGLAFFDKQTNQFVAITEKDGLQNNVIYKIVEDLNGLIWVSTNQGISSIDARSKKINNYSHHNGVQNNHFVRGAGLMAANGELFFGGLEGFNYFNPAFFNKNYNKAPVLITALKISNQLIMASSEGPIKQHISIAKQINLDYKQNFSLSYVGLSFTAPEQNEYAYKLDGFDKDWIYVGTTTTANYTNLDPGNYVFRVKAGNNDGVWSDGETTIKIYVDPPFWRTIYAYIFYILFLAGIAFYIRHRGIQRLKRGFAIKQEHLKAQQERREAARIRELDQLKIKFLTNLSHEFKTPISLILGPVDQLISTGKNDYTFRHLQMIKRNGRRLLNLVNQLLDFRKLEEHELTLQLTKGELISFVRETSDSFSDLSERKKIDFSFHSTIDELFTNFDHDKLERILLNVLSNAFKFTLEGGQIRLLIDRPIPPPDNKANWIYFQVTDTGIGIPADKKEKIFERFFQNETADVILNQGSGIGLSITREFVKLQGGTITVESQPGIGTSFSILLPFTEISALTNPRQIEASPSITDTTELTTLEDSTFVPTDTPLEKPVVLLVEDNEDFRLYLKDNLSLYYKVIEAENGKDGWQRALAQHPNLIVCDVSMPQMDGITLSRKLKADKRTAHIPIILLTVLAHEEDQIKGLETGANDYITKPFNFEVLNAKINNLLTLNTTFKNTYSKQIKMLGPEVEVQSEEEELLKTISLYLEENLTNSQLSVEELSRHVGMSRSSLYNKLLEITGQTPVEYIRTLKLEKAAIFLEKSEMNVAQVAYSVGFATPNYFAKSFKAKYNMLPSEYMNLKRKVSTREK